MAIANSDGSIILSTKVDTSGMEQGTKSLKSQAAKLAAEYRKAGMSQSEAFKKAWSEIERTRKETEKATKSTQTYGEKAKTAFQGVGDALKGIAGYLAVAFSVTKLIQFSNESASLATQTEASVQRLVDIYGSASDSVGNFIDANSRALGMSKAAAASFSSAYGNLFSVWADQATNAELTNRYLNMTAVVASKTGRTVEDVQERIRSGLLGNTEAIEDLGIFVNVKTIEMTDAFQRMANGKSWEQLDAYTQQQIRSMAILEQATAKYGDEVADTSATMRNRYKAAYEDFKNSWGNIVNTVLLPVLETLTQIFDVATKGLNVLSGRSGQVLENVELQEENTDKTAENIEEQAKNQKELNKELKKSLAGFDDIQILSANAADNTSGGGGANFANLGLGGSSPDGSAYVNEVNETLGAIMGIVGFSLAALGIILLCFGQIGWGLGFLIGGAAIFGVSQASLSEGEEAERVKDIMNGIIAGISLLALILGIILVATGVALPLGIGLIIAGAAGLATEVALNWDFLNEKAKHILTELGGIIATAGAALIVLGIIICCTGAGVGLGVGLILAGAAGLVAAVSVNWDAIVDWVKSAWNAVKAFWNQYIAPIFTKKWWEDTLSVIGDAFVSVIASIKSFFAKAINWIIEGLNQISFDVPDWVQAIGGKTFGFEIPKLTVPKLAKGAVIPPNREFLAVLGDQKQGTNIEAPLQTIVDAFNTALQSNGRATREEHYYLEETELMRIIYKLAQGGERIYGNNLLEAY